ACVFFFQAEDGIRDPLVTGVQTCALPIFTGYLLGVVSGEDRGPRRPAPRRVVELREAQAILRQCIEVRRGNLAAVTARIGEAHEIGRASCRERVERWSVAGVGQAQ